MKKHIRESCPEAKRRGVRARLSDHELKELRIAAEKLGMTLEVLLGEIMSDWLHDTWPQIEKDI